MILALEIRLTGTRQGNTVCSSDTVTSNYLGGTMTGTSSVLHGETSVLWGALGRLEGIVQSGDDEARWALLDRLGSVVAEATGVGGADISELVSYAEYGEPSLESIGYQNPYGFTGQLQDGGTGRVSFGSRDYDPATAAWFAPDEWPGLLAAPQSLNRYAYVLGNPVTYADLGGFRPYEPGYSVTKNGSGWQYQKQAPPPPGKKPANSGLRGIESNIPEFSKNPSSLSHRFESERHATATRQAVAGSCGPTGLICIDARQVERDLQNAKRWASSSEGRDWSRWLGTISVVTLGGAALIKHPYVSVPLLAISAGTGLASTAIDCLSDWKSVSCALGGIGVIAGGAGSSVTRIPVTASKWAQTGGIFFQSLSIHSGVVTTIVSWGEWWESEV